MNHENRWNSSNACRKRHCGVSVLLPPLCAIAANDVTLTLQSEEDVAPMLAQGLSKLKQELETLRRNASSLTFTLQQELVVERANHLHAFEALNNAVSDAAKASSSTETSLPPLARVCSLLPNPIPSPLAHWNSHILSILNATRYRNDPKHLLDDYTAQVLQMILPRLPKSIKTLPYSQWLEVHRVLELLQARLHYLHHKGPEARKVRITVMGGSVVVGVNCRSVLQKMGISLNMPNKLCSWPMRLESFINNILGGDVVEVTKVAMGGTNTETANLILQYGLLPDRHPDVLIHAYSTNDMYYYTLQSAQHNNITLREETFELVQTFVRLILKRSHCQNATRPLLIHVDDYLGNEQYKIYKTTEYSQGIQVLVNYYGFASLSYADAVRDWVYADTRETWLSPPGWYKNGKYEKEIHPTMAMHLSMAWMVAYNSWNMASTYCSMTTNQQSQQNASGEIEYHATADGFPPLTNQHVVPSPKPRHVHQSLPPLVTQDLSLEHVSSLWENATDAAAKKTQEDCLDESQSPCLFGWILGLDNDMKIVKQVFETYTTVNKGWDFMVDYKKWGWVPVDGVSSQLVMEFPNVTQPIRSISLLYMKSYGERWKDSVLRVSCLSRLSNTTEWVQLLHQDDFLAGTHAKNTSESYTHEIMLAKQVSSGSHLRVELELVNGSTFKIMGLTVCS